VEESQRKVEPTRRAAAGTPTMADIAAMAKVAPMTVSRALRSPEKVAEETRARIEVAIKALGYTPNSVAGALASNRKQFIVVVVPTITASIYADSYAGLSQPLLEGGYQLLLGNDGYSMEREEKLVSTFMTYRPAGLVLTGYSHTPNLRRMIHRSDLPVVETYNLTDKPLKVCIGYSNYNAMLDLTEHVIRRGHDKPVFLAADYPLNDRHSDRLAGFEAALNTHGLKLPWQPALPSPFSYEAASRAVGAHLDTHPETDAIIAGSYVLAIGALLECQRRGIKVPDQMAIAGFDDHELASMIEPGLTMVAVPRFEMGRAAAQLLLEQIAGRRPLQRILDIGYEIVQRGTT
jgi:LacI family gluconate utilization system Gnt-I transcriptional repressor